MTLDQFKKKLTSATPCVPVMYHRGELASQRRYMPEVHQVATFCRALHELGAVDMYQRRDDEGVMCYFVRPYEKWAKGRGQEDSIMQEAERLVHA